MNETASTPPSDASGWRTYKLGDLLRRHNEIIHPGDRKEGEAVFVGLEHIEPHTGRRIGSGTIDLGKLTGRKPTFRAGHIVYGYLRPYLNKVWLADFDGCSSVDQFAFEVRGELADLDYLAAFMRSDTFLRRSAVVTTTGQLPRISIDEIEAVEIELPPLAKQKHIAAQLATALASADKARRAAQERLAAAEALPGAYLQEVFEGPEASEWPTVSISDIAKVQTGFAFASESFTENGWRILRNANIHQGFIDWGDVVFLAPENAVRLEALALKIGDCVLSLDRPLVADGLKATRIGPSDVPSLLNQRVARYSGPHCLHQKTPRHPI